MLGVFGGVIFFRNEPFVGIPVYLATIACLLILNGLFLSFSVSPYLWQKEREGKSGEVLPDTWQRKITFSLLLSDIGWWGGLAMLVYYLLLP
jgi:hypothetical protein